MAIAPFAFAADICPAYDRETWRIEKKTRLKVLAEESLVPAGLSADGRKVNSGRWRDPYTNRIHNSPGEIDIDHRVPLKEAHDSGGYAWGAAKRRAYANDLSDPEHLVAVATKVNRGEKNDKDPAEWLPPYKASHAEYARNWVRIKRHWGLTADQEEADKLQELLGSEEVQLPIAPEGCPPQAAPAPKDSCCTVCRTGKACGNSCISRSKTCRKQLECACQE